MAIVCAGLYPSFSRIFRPPKRYGETVGGSQELLVRFDQLRLYLLFLKNSNNFRFFVKSRNISPRNEVKLSKGEYSQKVEEELFGGLSEVYPAAESVLATSTIHDK